MIQYITNQFNKLLSSVVTLCYILPSTSTLTSMTLSPSEPGDVPEPAGCLGDPRRTEEHQ